MATDFNNVTLIGRLTADPVSKYLPSGSAVVEFSIANNYYVSTKNATEVNYFDVVAFGKMAETVSKYLTKGICNKTLPELYYAGHIPFQNSIA